MKYEKEKENDLNHSHLKEMEKELEIAEKIIFELYNKNKTLEIDVNKRKNIKINDNDKLQYNDLYILHTKTENYLKGLILNEKERIDKLNEKMTYLIHENEELKENKLKGYNINDLLSENEKMKNENKLLKDENSKLRNLYNKVLLLLLLYIEIKRI